MDSSRPRLTPTKSHEDAFMDALLEGLGPTDFAFSSPSPPQKSKLCQTADLCQFRSTEDGSLPHKGPARSQNVSTSLSKGPRRSADRSSKCASQLPEPKRQGSLMQYAKRPQPSQSSCDIKIVARNSGYDVKARSAKRASPHCKITKTNTYIAKNTPSISTSAETHLQASCASPPLAGLSVRMHQSPVYLPTRTITRHLPITLNSQKPLHNCHEDYAALFSGLEEGWDAVSDDESEQQSKPPPLCQQYTKCVVSGISSQPEWNAANRRLENRIEVTLQSITGPVRKTLLLCDDWAETRLEPADEMNLVSLPGSPALDLHQDVITFSRSEPGHLIILIPSLLISATVVATALSCPRRGVLNDRIRNSQNEIGEAVVRGTIVHEVIQNMLLPNEQTSTDEELSNTPDDIPELWSETRVLKEAKDACIRHVSDLLTIQQTVEQGVTMVTEHLKELPAWSSKYIVQEDEGKTFKIKKDAHLLDPRSCVKQDAARPKIGITAVCDVEEEIWSPKFGLKGKVDVTAQAAIIEDPQTTGFFQADELVTKRTHLLPLEIKTGRRSCGVEHTAQTMLYTLLMSDRYNVDISAGLLFYTSFNEVTRVQAVKAEVRHLIIARNQLASYIHKRAIKHQEAELSQASIGVHESSNSAAGDSPVPDIERTLLPEPIDNPQTCSRCYAVETCMLFRKTIEKVDEIPFQRGLESLQAMYQDKTEHLTPIHSAFFSRWESLVSLEERELGRFKKEIWELTAEKRQRYGRAFADMVIDESFDSTQWSESAKPGYTVHQYTYCLMSSIPASSTGSPLKSQTCAPNVLPTQSLLTSQIGVGDPIVVSIEGEKLALAKGFVCELTPYRIVIGVDHRLDNPGPVPVGSIIKKRATQHTNTPKILYRIDKDELMAGMGRLRDNLAQLFYADGDYKRRELIVDLRPPEFDVVLKTGQDLQFNHLNEDQRSAIDKYLHSIESQTCVKRCWLADVLAPERRVVFVDTDKIESRESKMGTLVQNGTEADLVVQIVTALLHGGVPASEIGVITPYRQQIKLLVYLLEHTPGVEIITADKAQGRDKACVIMTMVRSNKDEEVGQLLRDWRRINVCLTRARQKLIILGSRETLKCSDILGDFLALVEVRKWIYVLQPGDELAHQSMSSGVNDSHPITLGGLSSSLLPLKRKSSLPTEKISAGLRNIRKTHTVLKDLTTHILLEG
ncbi:hypothetical protein CROQUDRAFT_39662 [Cronartium quercuum f. sp. fusiforme G11]|uniref:DNA replication ATP-dependent helicase/nuclease n=1 Tax=Cronartium quercuum f. sp. fusiforme G11 TaxID=708437 RepID=A0A9P6TFE4_9BASI|nr:hypothetical protein CROQUDRAFT_39662 [Cronartium quercuum f. sp. fusiforme G11]